eukprot:35139-Eustigmatos_ZCMA.PRE.1
MMYAHAHPPRHDPCCRSKLTCMHSPPWVRAPPGAGSWHWTDRHRSHAPPPQSALSNTPPDTPRKP